MISIAWWLFEHWWLVLWVVATAVAYTIGGWRLALAIGTLGASSAAYAAGRAAADRANSQKQEKERAEAQRLRKETDDEISSLDDAAVRDRLGKWMRDGR